MDKKDTRMNELEMLFAILRRALEMYVSVQSSVGYVFNRGTVNETRMKYMRALELLKALEDYFALRGAYSFGICSSCGRWRKGACSTEGLGHCTRRLEVTSRFDSCEHHSKEAGRYGL